MATLNALSQTLTPREKISKAKINLYKKSPFFSYLIEHMEIIEDREDHPCKTMAVDAKANLYYNDEFVTALSDEEMQGVLCHEVLHLAYEHPKRMNGRMVILTYPDGSMVTLWNIAIDMVVNNVVLRNNLVLPKDCIPIDTSTDESKWNGIAIKDVSNKAAEEIYDELKTALKKQLDKQSKGKGKGKGQPQQGQGNSMGISGLDAPKGFDEHRFDKPEDGKDGNGKGKGAEAKEAQEGKGKDWGKITSEAYNHAKMQGKEPLGLGREYEVKGKSRINWRAILRKEIAKNIPVDYTWSRPSKKYVSQGIYMPSTFGEEIKVLCSIDTSGSIGKKEIGEYASELMAIARSFPSVEFRILTHDTKVWDDIHIGPFETNKIKSMSIHGGGGTDIDCVHTYIKAKKYDKGHNIIIHFTDGYANFPVKPVLPTYFVLSPDHCAVNTLPKWSKGNWAIGN